MFVANGRTFTAEQVAEFQGLRLAVLENDPYAESSPQKRAVTAFTRLYNINLGQYAALEKEHDRVLGPEYFKRPPWTAKAPA